jgi:hypothetical protein
MRLPLAGALLCVSLGAHAQGSISVGSTIICDTSEQARRFVTLRNTGNETQQALQLINTEANKPNACGEAFVAFRRGDAIVNERVDGQPVNIVRITVLAFNNGAGWSLVPETEQYAVLVPLGIEV